MSNYNPRGGYESRSLLNEAIYNRVVREFELESLYKGSDRAAVEIMHKYDGTRQEMAWVLQGDSFTKSTAVFTYIDSIIKNFNPQRPGKGLGQKTRQAAMNMLPQFQEGSEQLSGGASQGTAGGNMQSHAPKEGLGSRFKTWAKERAAPALGRGLRHMGAGLAGGLATGNPLGVLAGVGGSMYQAHKGKQSGQYGKVMGGEGGLNQLAGDAAKQGGQAIAGAAQNQAQNFQTGQGVAGKVGHAAGAAKNMAQGAFQGMKNLGSNMVSGAKNAVQQAGATQQENLERLDPNQARIDARTAGGELGQQQGVAQTMMPPGPMPPQSAPPGNMQTHPPAATPPAATPQQPTAASGAPVSTQDPNDGQHQIIEREPTGNAQVDPAAAGQVAQQQAPQGAGMFQNRAGVFNNSNDTFSRIQDILKGN